VFTNEEDRKYTGIVFVPGRVGEEFAVIVPDGKGKTRTIGYQTSLEYAVAYRKNYIERNRVQPSADAPDPDPNTAATETGDHDQTSSQDKK
jgi:hypothetical protein